MIDKKGLRKELAKLYEPNKMTFQKYNVVLSKLEQFKEEDPFFYNYQTGKFIATFGNAEEALPYLIKAKGLLGSQNDKMLASLYYSFYKCYVKLEDFQSAFSSLYTCKQLSGDVADFSLPLNMLASIIDMDLDYEQYQNLDYLAENNNKIYFAELTHRYYSDLYASIVESFNCKDYNSMVEDLELLKFSSDNDQYPIEVNSLVLLGKVLKENRKKHCMSVIEFNEKKDVSLDEYLVSAQELLDGGMPVKRFFAEADKYIKSDLEKAEAIYNLICSRGYPYYDVEKEYLKNAIREQREYSLLPDSVAEQYKHLKEIGDRAYRSGKFILAEEKYREAFGISMLSISDYYIGKSLFKQGKIGRAKEYLDNYALCGGSKYDKCLLYLSKINQIFDRKSVAKKQLKLMERLNDSFQRDFVYEGLGSSSRLSRVESDFDRYKNSASQHIVVTEEDFVEDEQGEKAKISDFYDCDLDGKLSIIKRCLRHGDDKVANYLLAHIGTMRSTAEIEKVNQFQKNKKIYANQKRMD